MCTGATEKRNQNFFHAGMGESGKIFDIFSENRGQNAPLPGNNPDRGIFRHRAEKVEKIVNDSGFFAYVTGVARERVNALPWQMGNERQEVRYVITE